MSGISAQGSTLFVSSGVGTAKTITAISIGNPAIVTSNAHGLSNGTVVTLAAIAGTMAAPLNGTVRVVSNVTANTFALLDVDTTGLTYTSGGTATPQTYTKINGFMSFNLDGSSREELDVTDLDSTAKEFIAGLVDEGPFSYECKNLKEDPGQTVVRAAKTSGALIEFKLTLPDARVLTFSALVKSVPTSGGTNAVLKGTVACKVSGLVVES